MSDQPTPERTFEQALSELEIIVRDLEDGTTGLDEALARYEAGIGLLKYCYGQLRLAEQRILLLTGTDDESRPQTQLFEHETTDPSAGEGPEKRRSVTQKRR